MSLEEGMEETRRWLKHHYEIRQVKTFDNFAIVLAWHRGNTDGTKRIRGQKLYVFVETEESLQDQMVERHIKLANSVGQIGVVVPGRYLHEQALYGRHVVIIHHYGKVNS